VEKFILKFSTNAAICSALFLAAACSPVEVEDVNGLNPYAYVQGNFDQKTDAVLQGTGVVRFIETLAGVQSSRSVALKASLENSFNQSSVSVVMNSSNTNLPSNNGVVVKFQRSGINILVTISVNGNVSTVSSLRSSQLFPADLDLIVEVHNDFNFTRVLVWRRDSSIYSTETADIDSARSGDLNPAIPWGMGGPGIYMGLRLERAQVTAAQVDLGKVLEP
jgi:hypothetical protein